MRTYESKAGSALQAVIFDWAGTTVDFGCFAPTGVFIDVFRDKGIEITIEEARGPMGMHKRDHIRVITQYPRIAALWKAKYGREYEAKDIEDMFSLFIPLQLNVIAKYSEIVPELPHAIAVIRSLNLKIGSTTGYNNEMMDILMAAAAKQGYKPDSVVCATDVPAGRPAPWMAFKNAENLKVYPMYNIVKIGDTISDIEEGLNAGMWSVGVIMSSNEMGMTKEELSGMDREELESRKKKVRKGYYDAGAHYVIDTLADIGELIDSVNDRLSRGERP
jgi:phosphonoacetaldehyde hydrolase